MDGILIVDKPQGMTSHDVVSFLRRKTGVRRIGHSGTLDPMATGVLPVFIGRATRIIEYVGVSGDPAAKKYRCTMRLGVTTDTQDIWGECGSAPAMTEFSHSLTPVPPAPSRDEIERVLKTFEGEGTQKPPMYSAVKVDGRKLYEYARAGQIVGDERLRDRNIYINQIYVIDYDALADEVVFEVESSKGVYVRTICDDAGRLLGCGAAMSGLVRLASDGFTIEEAVPISALEDETTEKIAERLRPMESALASLPRVDLDEDGAADFVNGRITDAAAQDRVPVPVSCYWAQDRVPVPVSCYGPTGFLGIGMAKAGTIHPHKVIFRETI
ncbi:tRNA pseudouridine(55) synthase TruB [Clostridia bacterium]|nr:tRNA pseudouridine(55) synthase TruB [Clostridia bacterium]